MSEEMKPLVSVRLMVYNNEPYIREAVESILMQKTDFKVEIVVGDDFSTDNTLKIIQSYQNTENIYFKILKREIGGTYWVDRKKLGRLYNFKNIIDNCEGKYIALLDGDDYWSDPLKLQKQADFLEKNEEYNYCGHYSRSLTNSNFEDRLTPTQVLTFKDLIFKNYLNSATLMFRSESIDLPEFFIDINAGDWAIQLLSIHNSKAYVLDDFMSVYRIHNESIWNSISNEEKCMRGVVLQEAIKKIYNSEESIKIIDKAIIKRKKEFGLIKPSLKDRIYNKFS